MRFTTSGVYPTQSTKVVTSSPVQLRGSQWTSRGATEGDGERSRTTDGGISPGEEPILRPTQLTSIVPSPPVRPSLGMESVPREPGLLRRVLHVTVRVVPPVVLPGRVPEWGGAHVQPQQHLVAEHHVLQLLLLRDVWSYGTNYPGGGAGRGGWGGVEGVGNGTFGRPTSSWSW